ncbi:MAG: hypothetical protein LBO05_09165 [Deltaproteobacteria bacterium]|jgi:peptide chain release factor|nr:hypothetical protein [Deltaproteobacteria bacterium]
MATLTISSGRGPAECELAVGLYYARLARLHPDVVVVSSHGGRESTVGGQKITGYQSLVLRLPPGASVPEGTVKWRCPSPLRPKHGRRNWFFQVISVPDPEDRAGAGPAVIKTEKTPPEKTRPEKTTPAGLPKSDLMFATFRSPGKGGQNVNKVETGVRVTHAPSGTTASSTTARTQLANKKLAVGRLLEKLRLNASKKQGERKRQNWRQHDELVRGDAVQTFVGPDFQPA